MNTKCILLPFLVMLCSCTHPIDIVGEGDVRSSSAANDCLLEESPCKVVVVGEYVETYFPEPRSGYLFVGWDNCLEVDGESCVFNVPKDAVRKNWGKTMPALVAKFAPLCENAPADSFAGIQSVIFDGKGCSGGGCHSGGSPTGGMNLSAGQSYNNIVGVTAQSGGGLKRILPGDPDNSYLYRKVSAKTLPGSFPISGSPMPLVGTALTENMLDALELWIEAGAPRNGRVGDLNEVESLLGLCN